MRYAIYIDKFQPLTQSDHARLRRALGSCDRLLILIAGANRPRTSRDPLTWQERRDMIVSSLGHDGAKVFIKPLLDVLYDDALWVSHVRMMVDEDMQSRAIFRPESISIFVSDTPAGQAMGRLFPDWETQYLPGTDDMERARALNHIFDNPPTSISGEVLAGLKEERARIQSSRSRLDEAEKTLGYPIPLTAVDALVCQSGMVLLTKRPVGSFGEGLYAMPGAHLLRDETGMDAAIQAAKRKGGLDMPAGALSSRLKGRHVFDHPKRSPRGWIRTEVFHFDLPPSGRMENIKKSGEWIALSDIAPQMMYEDHFDIIQSLIRGVITRPVC